MTRIASIDQLPLSEDTRALNADLLAQQPQRPAPRKGSDLEAILAADLRRVGITDFVQEYRFHPTRRWRFDFAWPELMIACEVEGATWANGRHNRGAGYKADTEKYNEAARLGWTVYRYVGDHVKDGTAVRQIAAVLEEATP